MEDSQSAGSPCPVRFTEFDSHRELRSRHAVLERDVLSNLQDLLPLWDLALESFEELKKLEAIREQTGVRDPEVEQMRLRAIRDIRELFEKLEATLSLASKVTDGLRELDELRERLSLQAREMELYHDAEIKRPLFCSLMEYLKGYYWPEGPLPAMPLSLSGFLQSMGFDVVHKNIGSRALSAAVDFSGKPSVYLSLKTSREAENFVLGHELYHMLTRMGHGLQEDEWRADVFAREVTSPLFLIAKRARSREFWELPGILVVEIEQLIRQVMASTTLQSLLVRFVGGRETPEKVFLRNTDRPGTGDDGPWLLSSGDVYEAGALLREQPDDLSQYVGEPDFFRVCRQNNQRVIDW